MCWNTWSNGLLLLFGHAVLREKDDGTRIRDMMGIDLARFLAWRNGGLNADPDPLRKRL